MPEYFEHHYHIQVWKVTPDKPRDVSGVMMMMRDEMRPLSQKRNNSDQQPPVSVLLAIQEKWCITSKHYVVNTQFTWEKTNTKMKI